VIAARAEARTHGVGPSASSWKQTAREREARMGPPLSVFPSGFPQGVNVTPTALEDPDSSWHGPPRSRNQNWKYHVSPAAI